MGNHCIDCEFCGKDQRIHGDGCCKAYQDHKAKEEAEHAAKREAEDAYLSRYGLDAYDGKLYASDVIKVLKKFEGKTLKPGRVKKRTPPIFYDD